MDWSDSTWSLTDGGTENEAKPIIGDTVIFANAANDVTMDEASAALAGFTLGGGALDMASFAMTVNGNMAYSAGTLSNPGTVTQGGTSTLAWGSGTAALIYAQAAGSIISLITDMFSQVQSFAQPSFATLQSSEGRLLLVVDPSAGWWNALGTVDVEVWIREGTAPGNDIVLTDKPLRFFTSTIATLTMDANIDTGTGALGVDGTGTGDSMTLSMAGFALTCGAAILGATAANTGNGILNLPSGVHSIASVAGGNAANSGNTLALGTSTIRNMTTGIVGVDIDTVTVTAAHLYGDGSSTITDVDISAGGVIRCHNFDEANSTGNAGAIIFVTGVPGAIVPSGILQHTRHQNRRRSRRMA